MPWNSDAQDCIFINLVKLDTCIHMRDIDTKFKALQDRH